MPQFWKTAALDVYRRLTTPWRMWMMCRLLRRARAPLVLLYYHRVADRDPVPWSLTNRQFAAHVEWVERHFEMISLGEVQRRIRSGENRRPAVHITFDDGYAENCDAALPMLIERGIPCTYFVTLENLVNGKPFAHDLRIGKHFPVNTIGQLRELSQRGIEIGAHTRTHPDLGAVADARRLIDEVAIARCELENILGTAVRSFAFPFGMPRNLNGAVFPLARAAGLRAVCSAYGGYNFPGGDAFHLQRCHGDPQLPRLKNTLTLDPRQLARRPVQAAAPPGLDEEALELLSRQAGPIRGQPSRVIPAFGDENSDLPPYPAPGVA